MARTRGPDSSEAATTHCEHPILFQPPLVRAILDDYKSQTRRTNGLKAFNLEPDRWAARFQGGFAYFRQSGSASEVRVRCPYGDIGDQLWVRENGILIHLRCPDDPAKPGLFRHDVPTTIGRGHYWVEETRAAGASYNVAGCSRESAMLSPGFVKVVPSIHMPRWACRLMLTVKRISIERLNTCSESDAIAEGVVLPGMEIAMGTARSGFQALWNAINGDSSWSRNPWVWVIEFEKGVLPAPLRSRAALLPF